MAVDPEALAAELRYLRKGRGFRHPDLLKRLGPQSRALFGIAERDGIPVTRRKAIEAVESLLADEPPVALLTVLVALALHREADHRDLAARERWLAETLNVQERTVRRRVDEAFQALVRHAADGPDDAQDLAASDAWQVQSVRALLNLDAPSPELTEYRTVAFIRDGVDEIVTRFSLPQPCTGAAHDLQTELVLGGRIRRVDRPAPEHFRYVVELPRRYRRHETHDYVIRFRLPEHQVMEPHYALLPLLTVRALDLSIRFSPRRPPLRVWRFDGVPPIMINTGEPVGEVVTPDRFGEVQLSFRQLRQGLGYGAGWKLPPDGDRDPSCVSGRRAQP